MSENRTFDKLSIQEIDLEYWSKGYIPTANIIARMNDPEKKLSIAEMYKCLQIHQAFMGDIAREIMDEQEVN